jgi:transposase-like protein
MKQSDLSAIEKTLSSLPFDLKKYLTNWLSEQLDSQVDTVIETARERPRCAHCQGTDCVKWGHSSGLQRYRCRNPECRKSFNALTGTPLARLRQRSKWFDYLNGMFDSLTLRQLAARLNIDLKTAFRWRHRFLQSASALNANPLAGIVEVDETFFIESHKGQRNIEHRAPRERGGQGNKNKAAEKVSVIIARDRNGHVSDHVPETLSKANIHAFLAPIVDHESILCSDGASWYKTFAAERGIAHHRLITLDHQRVIGKEFHIQNVNGYISRLKGWIRRFHGVGTAYLPNYLAWRRLFETTEKSEENWLRLAAVGFQQ